MSPSLPVRGPRLWLLRLLALLLVPLAFGLVEAALRLLDIGHETRFLVKTESGHLTSNPRFSERFFPPTLARPPVPFVLEAAKPDDVFRIFVVGGSAARGTPEPAFGVARVLEAVLEESYPGRRFEVVNAAITAINSHVALPIVRDIAKQGDADLVIVYLGNNEVVGPWGAASVLGDFSTSRRLIQGATWLRSLRLGQVLDRMLAAPPPQGGWRGMSMFLGQRVSADDPRLEAVYANFAANLRDMARATQRGGAHIAFSTVAVNLAQAPFAAVEAGAQAQDLEARLGTIRTELAAGHADSALALGEELAGEHPTDARVHHLRGLIYTSLSRPVEAREALELARDLDTLRFRADSRINREIRQVAAGQNVALIDAAEIFAARPRESRDFLEHVHLRFEGNLALASLFRDLVAEELALPADAPISPGAVARRLAFTPEDALAIELDILALVKRPPFKAQAEDLVARHRQIQQLQRLTEAPTGRQQIESIYRQRLEAKPEDLLTRRRWAEILEGWGEPKKATEYWRYLVERRPDLLTWRRSLAVALSKAGDSEAAIDVLERAILLHGSEARSVARIRIDLGGIHEAAAKTSRAAEQYRLAHELDPANPLPPFNLAMLAAQRGAVDQALRDFESVVDTFPDFAPALQNLGVALEKIGEPEAAEEAYRREIARRPEAAESHFRLGVFLLTQDRAEEAVESFKEAINREPDHSPSYFRLADLFLQAGEMAAAEALYQQGLIFKPQDAHAQGNLRRIQGSSAAP